MEFLVVWPRLSHFGQSIIQRDETGIFIVRRFVVRLPYRKRKGEYRGQDDVSDQNGDRDRIGMLRVSARNTFRKAASLLSDVRAIVVTLQHSQAIILS